MKVGDLIGSGRKGEIRLSAAWETEAGQKVPVKLRNADTGDIVSLVDKLHGFYVYRISCECDGKRSGVPSVIKVGRSMNDLRQRLLSFPGNYSMNDVKLLKVIIFKRAGDAQSFETGVKRALRVKKIVPATGGYEWFPATQQAEIMAAIKEYRAGLKPLPSTAAPRVQRAKPTRVRALRSPPGVPMGIFGGTW